MATRVLYATHFTDAQLLAFFDAVMARWPTNPPLMAIGGFSSSYPSGEWRHLIEAGSTHLVSSATLAARDAAFSIVFRRSRDGGAPDEICVSWNDPDAASNAFPADDAGVLADLADMLARGNTPKLGAPAAGQERPSSG